MLHLRIVAPERLVDPALDLLARCASVINIAHHPGVARNPEGDLIECDVAREEGSVILADLRELGLAEAGTLAVLEIDSAVSRHADEAERAAAGAPADAVVWEELGEQTSESSTLSGAFVLFMVLAAVIAAVGILLDSAILIVGAMVVGPEFGPLAGVCVALVERRGRLAARSAAALAAGFPAAILTVVLVVGALRLLGVVPDSFSEADHSLSRTIASPDELAFLVAFCAGTAGMLSLSTAKSGALIGVLISVTTIPAASNVGVSLLYGDGPAAAGSAQQLGLNLGAIVLAGLLTLTVQRALYARRRARHLRTIAARDDRAVAARER